MFYQEEEIVDDDDFRIFTYINDKIPQAIHIPEKTPPRIKTCTPRLLISEVSTKSLWSFLLRRLTAITAREIFHFYISSPVILLYKGFKMKSSIFYASVLMAIPLVSAGNLTTEDEKPKSLGAHIQIYRQKSNRQSYRDVNIQRSATFLFPGCVYFCLALPGSCLAKQKNILAALCR